ncbi:DUF4352 domain-containing protein [Oceanobacillus jordanicus]|uniref:DUF4352 domain-containing protein n=1 Tax=Oceanobacillus jordanicus TaxID=2867266 RepID=A0AAW5B9W1_9BACI|nr:DUF4352 domain-containing protein [Oceanobacillus jordanicus]MCG3420740.1 DUF4352 domain-containing protein [Oceanobacillus jordanicus]
MKYLCFSIVLSLGLFLTACNEEEQKNTTENDDVSEGTSESESGSDEQEDGSDDGTTGETENGEEGISVEDQLGLKIGDTATVENNFTEFEMTLDGVELTEEAGETPSEQGNYVIVDLTITNSSDEPLTGGDAFSSTRLETKENKSGFTWFYIDGVVEAWDSEIAPNDTQSGKLLYDVEKSEEYTLTLGKNLEGLTNQVTYTFTPEESK